MFEYIVNLQEIIEKNQSPLCNELKLGYFIFSKEISFYFVVWHYLPKFVKRQC